jgi:hypothetical protein
MPAEQDRIAALEAENLRLREALARECICNKCQGSGKSSIALIGACVACGGSGWSTEDLVTMALIFELALKQAGRPKAQVKQCSECRWWLDNQPPNGNSGRCYYPRELLVIPISADVTYFSTLRTQGSDCPTWEAKEE